MLRLLRALFGSSSRGDGHPTGDPEGDFDRALEAMERQLADVELSMLEVAEARRRLESERVAAEETAGMRTSQAERAAAIGRDDLARRALSLRNDATREAAQLGGSVQQVASHEDSLAVARNRLGHQVNQLRSRRVEMGARLTAAEAQLQLRGAAASAASEAAEVSRLSEGLVQRAGRPRDESPGHAESLPVDGGDPEDVLEQEIAGIERERRIEAELRRLKREALADRSAHNGGERDRQT